MDIVIMKDPLASRISPDVGKPTASKQGLRKKRLEDQIVNDEHLVVLLSGGLDSSLVIGWYINERGYKPINIHPLFVNYDQAWFLDEREAALEVCRYYNTSPLRSVDRYLGVGGSIREYDVNRRLKGYIPLRNIHLFNLAADYVIELQLAGLDCPCFASGSRFSAYPDTTQEFFDRYNFMLDVSVWERLSAENPFAWWGTKRIYGYAKKIKFPLDISSSCQDKQAGFSQEGRVACGKCNKCRERATHGYTLDLIKATS